jgi:hypothetical protein
MKELVPLELLTTGFTTISINGHFFSSHSNRFGIIAPKTSESKVHPI